MGKYEDLRGDEHTLLAITGRAWIFGDHISQPQLLGDAPRPHSPGVDGTFVLAGINPQFARQARPGDFIVAGLDFGAGVSSREVPVALTARGIAAVVARSFGGSFYRHAIDCGLPALMVEETRAIKSLDVLRVDVEAHIVANLSSGDRYVIRNIDDDALALLRDGGRGATGCSAARRRPSPRG